MPMIDAKEFSDKDPIVNKNNLEKEVPWFEICPKISWNIKGWAKDRIFHEEMESMDKCREMWM